MRRKSNLLSWLPTVLMALGLFLVVWAAEMLGLLSTYWHQVIQLAGITAISALGLNLIYGFNGQFSLGHIGFYAIGAYSSALITKDFRSNWSGTQVGPLAWIMAAEIALLVILISVRRLRVALLNSSISDTLGERPIVIFLFSLALVVGVFLSIGLQKLLFPLLQLSLLGVGTNVGQILVFAIAIISSGVLAAIIAYLIGLSLLRLGSDYFGIATLGFAIMTYTALQNSDLVIPTMKGARGMVGIPHWTTWGWVFFSLVLCVVIMRNLIWSSHGRAIVAIREDEMAAGTMGVDANQLKALAFASGGLFAGVAGALYAHLYGFLHPSSFGMIRGFDPLIIIVFGGLGSMTGTIVASGVFALVIEGLRVLLPQGFEDWRFVIYPVLLLAVMLLRQEGLLGRREWGWLRAPLPPTRDVPTPSLGSASGGGEQGKEKA